MILTANYYQSLFNVFYQSYEDIIVTGNPKEQVGEINTLIGPELERSRYDKEIVYTCDKDVTLSNGKTVSKGKPIKMEQLKDIVITEDLNITPRYVNDFKLFNIEELNIDLIYGIIFVIIVVFAGIHIYKNKKK